MLPKVKQFKPEVTFEKDLLDFTARRSIKLGSDLDGNAARKQFRMSRRLPILILTRSPIRVINFRPLPSSAHHQFRSDHPSKSTSEQIIKLTVSLSSRFPRSEGFRLFATQTANYSIKFSIIETINHLKSKTRNENLASSYDERVQLPMSP